MQRSTDCRPARWLTTALVAGMASAAAAQPQGQASSSAGIYTCVTADGRRLSSDRPIPACNAQEQRVLNSDGSLQRIHPPSLTAEERAAREAADRRAQAERTAQLDAIRRDRNLMSRFPNEAAHRKAREASLDTVRVAIRNTELRLERLAAERKPLDTEAEFYRGRTLPPRLRQQIDANEAAAEAQRAAAQTQSAELSRINRLYDIELERLRRLWAGAPAGSLGSVQALPASDTRTGVKP
ncbi:hypothetical protein V4F39_14800 [Aquincola sp. MAHUQ-54]|uniref:DUF4124 domain-containing protein n=1 Tax=Aquincola agrisoli TaxID=3119538 RepID=A0AAW9QFN4_9BURK